MVADFGKVGPDFDRLDRARPVDCAVASFWFGSGNLLTGEISAGSDRSKQIVGRQQVSVQEFVSYKFCQTKLLTACPRADNRNFSYDGWRPPHTIKGSCTNIAILTRNPCCAPYAISSHCMAPVACDTTAPDRRGCVSH